jgi:hypothetical protein
LPSSLAEEGLLCNTNHQAYWCMYCIYLRSFSFNHFKMLEVTGLESTAL